MYTEKVPQNFTPFVFVKGGEVKTQESRPLKQWLTFLEKKVGTNNFVFPWLKISNYK